MLLCRLGGWGAILIGGRRGEARRWRSGDDVLTPRMIRGEYAVITGEVLARWRDEGGELGQKIDRCTYHARGTMPMPRTATSMIIVAPDAGGNQRNAAVRHISY